MRSANQNVSSRQTRLQSRQYVQLRPVNYFILGDAEKYLRAATNGLRMVQKQSYATGGWGPDEAFVANSGSGAARREPWQDPFQFRNPVRCLQADNSRSLPFAARDARLALRRQHGTGSLQHRCGRQPILPDGTSFYYSDYTRRRHKSLLQGQMALLFRHVLATRRRLRHVLLLPVQRRRLRQPLPAPLASLPDARRHEMHSRRKTSYPTANTTQLELEMVRPEKFTVYLRVPAWADPKTRISVNGKSGRGCRRRKILRAIAYLEKQAICVDGVKSECLSACKPSIQKTHRSSRFAVARSHSWHRKSARKLFARSIVSRVRRFASSGKTGWVQGDAGKITFKPFGAVGDEPIVSITP